MHQRECKAGYNNQFLNEGGFVERNGYMENTHWR